MKPLFFFPRDYNEIGSPAEGGEGSAQPQDLTPQQQHQQYLGESKPELDQFPDIQWAGTPIPGEDSQNLLWLYRELIKYPHSMFIGSE